MMERVIIILKVLFWQSLDCSWKQADSVAGLYGNGESAGALLRKPADVYVIELHPYLPTAVYLPKAQTVQRTSHGWLGKKHIRFHLRRER